MKIKCLTCGKKFDKRGIGTHQRVHRNLQPGGLTLGDEIFKLAESSKLAAEQNKVSDLSYREREAQIVLAEAFARVATTFSTIFGEWRR